MRAPLFRKCVLILVWKAQKARVLLKFSFIWALNSDEDLKICIMWELQLVYVTQMCEWVVFRLTLIVCTIYLALFFNATWNSKFFFHPVYQQYGQHALLGAVSPVSHTGDVSRAVSEEEKKELSPRWLLCHCHVSQHRSPFSLFQVLNNSLLCQTSKDLFFTDSLQWIWSSL